MTNIHEATTPYRGNVRTDIDALLDMLNETNMIARNAHLAFDAQSEQVANINNRLREFGEGRQLNIKYDYKGEGLARTLQNATHQAAGADLHALITPEDSDDMIPSAKKVRRGKITTIDTGVAVEIPRGHFGLLALRSSLGREGLCIPNGVGIIDSDYRGTIKVTLTKVTRGKYTIYDGDRIAQLVIIPHIITQYVYGTDLSATQRGTGGFGSTGR